MEVLDAMEAKKVAASASAQAPQGRTLVGSVDRFFDKINVAAVMLTGDLKVGDTVEIENEDYALRQKVSSMQIDRKDVDEAYEGDDVGIKLRVPVSEGSSVYRLD